jgi:hypothetical protein
MFGLGAGHVWFRLLESARKSDMSGFSGMFECKEFFEDLHFTNSLNASHLIVRSS